MLLSLFIILFCWILSLFLPWWSIAIPGLILGYTFNKKALPSFGWGFLAVFLFWTVHAVIIHFRNDGLLSERIADLLTVSQPWIVILATGLIGGIVGGLATLTGSLFNTKRISPNVKKV